MLRRSLKLVQSTTRLARFGVRVKSTGPSPDGIYRRPMVPGHSSQIADDAELMIEDAQSPEPAFDVDPDIGLFNALARMTLAFGTIAVFYWMLPDPQNSSACPGKDGNTIIYREDYLNCRYPNAAASAPVPEAAEE
mmetsp:Transcript_5419/g.13205  ORF Transcript_5419/g.13205 Transcript_5419/m.13205 type:complete len:136 (-) Transcript_5419:319-726(-)